MTMRKKLLITIACLSCILCIMVTGTIAWLIDDTETITNTFTPSNITVELKETDGEDVVTGLTFQMIPGKTYAKDPLVTVTSDIKCYVFLVVNESDNLGTYIDYALDIDEDAWQLVDGTTNVYYRVAEAGTDSYGVLVADKNAANPKWGDNEVYVKGSVTKDHMAALYNTDGSLKTENLPKLSFTAYACQYEGFNSAALAWAEINP